MLINGSLAALILKFGLLRGKKNASGEKKELSPASYKHYSITT